MPAYCLSARPLNHCTRRSESATQHTLLHTRQRTHLNTPIRSIPAPHPHRRDCRCTHTAAPHASRPQILHTCATCILQLGAGHPPTPLPASSTARLSAPLPAAPSPHSRLRHPALEARNAAFTRPTHTRRLPSAHAWYERRHRPRRRAPTRSTEYASTRPSTDRSAAPRPSARVRT